MIAELCFHYCQRLLNHRKSDIFDYRQPYFSFRLSAAILVDISASRQNNETLPWDILASLLPCVLIGQRPNIPLTKKRLKYQTCLRHLWSLWPQPKLKWSTYIIVHLCKQRRDLSRADREGWVGRGVSAAPSTGLPIAGVNHVKLAVSLKIHAASCAGMLDTACRCLGAHLPRHLFWVLKWMGGGGGGAAVGVVCGKKAARQKREGCAFPLAAQESLHYRASRSCQRLFITRSHISTPGVQTVRSVACQGKALSGKVPPRPPVSPRSPSLRLIPGSEAGEARQKGRNRVCHQQLKRVAWQQDWWHPPWK